MNFLQRVLHRPFFIKLLHWEYWSFNTVYGPILPVWLLLCARAKSFFFFSASNPTIENGGFLMESKMKIYDLIPPSYFPRTLFFLSKTPPEAVLEQIKTEKFTYPLIGKPNIGYRGMGVKKLNTESELIAYSRDSSLDFLIQEYVSYPNEVGIFYCRIPGERQGRITGIVAKEFLGILGDGKHSIRQLLQAEKRYILQLDVLEKMFGEKLNEVPEFGKQIELIPYGNHARGAKFLDHSHLSDPGLVHEIDSVCRQIRGFYYGRLDIRFHDWEQLKQGKLFSIIELNGAGSEPTHMYDPRHSIFFAWKEIIRHWMLLSKISRKNHGKGIPYLSFKEGREMFRENSRFEKKLQQSTFYHESPVN